MWRKIVAYVLLACGLLLTCGGAIFTMVLNNEPFYHYALTFLIPGYLVALIGFCLWLGRYFELPNILTISRIMLVPLILIMLIPGIYNPATAFIACLIFCLASITDALDGWLARRLHVVSNIGKFLDPLSDKLIYLTILVALLPRDIVPMWLVLIVLIRELFITGLRTVAAGEGLIIAASKGGKIKTIFGLVGIAFLLVHHTYEVDFGLFSCPVNFHLIGLILTYISLFFCLTSAGEYTYRVVKLLTFDKESKNGQND